MSLLTTIIGYAKRFFAWEYWPYLIAILALIPVILVIIYLIRKRRAKGDKKKTTPPEGEKEKKEEGIPVSGLAKVWKGFLKEIPWELRRSIMVYEHFVVFGEAGAGKSALIDNYTDWQGHARQFYPSYTTNPLLQIYLGSKVLVQELSSSLLNDTSENARRALLKLWKPLFRRKAPTVVVIVSGAALQTEEPEYLEYLKQKAQIIRGKINLLSRICRKPIKVRIALTYMDQFEGFYEFSQFLSQSNIPLKFSFSSTGDLSDLTGCLEPYEEHLTRALTTLPADKYLKMMTFMRHAPRLFQYLSMFVKFFQSPDPLSLGPEVTELYLTSQMDVKTPVLNPFAPSITAKELKEFDPLFKHRVAAAAVCVAGIVLLSAAYIYERNLIVERYRLLSILEASPPARYDQRMHALLPATFEQKHAMMKMLPDFFPHANKEITRRCIDNIRKFYLYPALDRFSMHAVTPEGEAAGHGKKINIIDERGQKFDDGQDKMLYLLALFYATRDNELGSLVQDNLTRWSQVLNMSEIMIGDYVQNNESSRPVFLDVKKFSYRETKRVSDDPRAWMAHFGDISRLCQQPVLTAAEFDKVQKNNGRFLEVIQRIEFYDLAARISDLLKKESPLGISLELIATQDAPIKQESVKNFLKFVKNSSMNYPEVTNELKLPGMYEHLKNMINDKGLESEKDLQFQILFGKEEFKISAQQWTDLMNRSRITLFLRDFISRNKRQDGLLFFTGDKEFEDLIMNVSNDGRFLFTGHARVDGRFTKEALEKRVKPVLTDLPALIENLPIPQKDKSYFSNFLFKETEIYGRRYAQYYRKYYMEFDVKAGSPGALRYVLSQMVLPSSPFMEVLLTMRDNTQIDSGTNVYLRSLSLKLAEFEFLRRLMGEQKGTFPELEKYKALLDQMQMDMQDQAFAAKKDKDESCAVLKSRLTPLGRISFSIFRGEQDSYVNLVKLWLNSVGIPAPWQDVFLAPVWQAYFLGMADVETGIGKLWTELRQNDILPLYNKFPFDISSRDDVTIETLRNATHPHGHFWQTFQKMLAPFCSEEGGQWRRRGGPYDYPRLPATMISTVNGMARLSATLWDKEGKERPFEFMIKTNPLPQARSYEPVAVLSYLQVGETSVFGFNQQPSWKKMKFSWHNPSKASVGAEFAVQKRSSRIKSAIEIPSSYWSFYHLLLKTEEYAVVSKFYDATKGPKSAWSFYGPGEGRSAKATRILTWVIDTPATEVESRPIDIKFAIQNDPWALFKLPR
jgi:hypothetical protein